MRDIEVTSDAVIFRKKLWGENEISLAKCMNFIYDDGTITAYLKVTILRALFEFIKVCFKNFNESLNEKTRRDQTFSHIKSLYDTIYLTMEDIINPLVPHYGMLRVHQKDGLISTYGKKYNFLAYEMGLGKTLTSASMSLMWDSKVTLIVCPSSVKWNWFRDLVKHGYNDLYFTIIDASKKGTVKAFREKFIIINYDIVAQYTDYIVRANPSHIILDEAHNIKNVNTRKFKSIANLLEKLPDARVTFLSGTPVKNRVNDVFAYLKLIQHHLGNNYQQFQREYLVTSNGKGGRVTGAKNLQDLYAKMSNFMIRRTASECLDLPEKNFVKYTFQMDDYREEYIRIVKELAKTRDVSSLNSQLNTLNIVVAKSKIKGIIDIAENIINEGRKVVIFSGYREPLEMLEEHFVDHNVMITGSVDSHKRDEYVQKFYEDEECNVFLGQTIAAGVGINLTCSSDIIFCNFPYTPSELDQCIARCHRMGQGTRVNVYFTFAEDSIDDYLYQLVTDKQGDISELIDRGVNTMDTGNIQELLISEIKKRYGQEGEQATDGTVEEERGEIAHQDNGA